tara:strand:- start:1362 stop:1637 length:276 start_codon:yes stop_codon:yes gene_type:complete
MNPFAKILVNVVKKQIKKQIAKKYDMPKIDKYVNEENELDRQMVHLQRKVNKQGMYIEELEKDVAMLKRDSHTPVKGLEYRLEKLEEKNKS